MTPRTRNNPSAVGAAAPVPLRTSSTRPASSASSARLMRNGLACCSLVTVRVNETLPRFSRLPTALRAGFSRRSKPCGTRQRISRLRPLTLRASHTQRRRSSDPCARAYPVMLAINNPLRGHSTGRVAARHSSIGSGRRQRAPPRGYPMKSFSSIVITGASSGIGEALALDYAAPGVALALTGRDAERLDAVAAACRAKGAAVTADTIDVVERERLAAWLTAFDDAHPVDLVIANAGISIDKDNSSLDDFSVIRHTFDVNVDGVLNTVEPLLSRLMARGRGQIAI